jgi:hypothetical protein
MERNEIDVNNIKAKMNEILETDTIENFIKKNSVEFTIGEIAYRVNKPDYKQKQEVNKKRISKYQEFLNEKDEKGNFLYKTEEELRKQYKLRGTAVEDLEGRFDALDNKKNTIMLKLGEYIKNNKPDNDLKVLRDEIAEIISEQQELTIRKTNLLETSIEMQILMYMYTYLAFITTEKKEGENWIRVWNTWEEFEKADNELMDRVIFYASLISRG